jgi:hypothetical protein
MSQLKSPSKPAPAPIGQILILTLAPLIIAITPVIYVVQMFSAF